MPKHFSHTLTTTAPKRIWSLWTDVQRWPNWDTELEHAALHGPFELGAGGRLKSKGSPPSTFVVTEFERGTRYTFTTELPWGSSLNVKRYLAREGEATCFTHEVWFSGPLALPLGATLGRRFKAALPGVMERLKQLAEAIEQTP
jgi:hypothetical protein